MVTSGGTEKLPWSCQAVLRSLQGYNSLYEEVGMVPSGCTEKLVWLYQVIMQ